MGSKRAYPSPVFIGFLEACEYGDMEKAKSRLSKCQYFWGAGVIDQTNNYGENALMWAVQNNHREIVEWLLSEGANPNQKTKYYTLDYGTFLEIAIQTMSVKIAVLLIENGADVDVGKGMNSIIWQAFKMRHFDLFELIVSKATKGFNPTSKGKSLIKALQAPVFEEYLNVIKRRKRELKIECAYLKSIKEGRCNDVLTEGVK